MIAQPSVLESEFYLFEQLEKPTKSLLFHWAEFPVILIYLHFKLPVIVFPVFKSFKTQN